MKTLILILSLLAGTAQAAPRILQGDWELGGGLNFTHYDVANLPSGNIFSLNADGQHFFADHFSAGLELNLNATGGNTSFVVGPVATKYLWVDDKLAPYISLLPIMVSTRTGATASLQSRVRVGAKVFLTDSVAFGPALEYQHLWEADSSPGGNLLSFLALFSIHL